MADTFRITLRDVDGFEGFDSRTFDLALNTQFPIGRASKNTTKQDLMPAASNAYIDSPVISRNHAVLSADAHSGSPQVFITDLGSMHGTMVNGERLSTNKPMKLSSGDKLQFGIDVNRNDEFFVARKYHFEARLDRAPTPFSLGFTVPDSDGEEADGTTPRRGSQYNPLTIDDSDSESNPSEDEQVDATLIGEGFIVTEEDDEKAPAAADIHLLKETFPQTVHDIDLVQHSFSENEGSGYYSSDAQDHDLDDFNTEASIMGDSIAEYDSDIGPSDFTPKTTSKIVDLPVEADVTRSLPAMELQVPTHTSSSSRGLFEPSDGFDTMHNELPSMNVPRQEMEHVFTPQFPPPLPPRPSAAQAPSSNRPTWQADLLPYPYLDTSADRPTLFSPSSCAAPLNVADLFVIDNDSTNMAPTLTRPQTPPSMLRSDATTSATPPPNRRTKVSIGEIVEDQPPTPESLNGMKRKADVFDEEEIPVVKSSILEIEPVTEAAVHAQLPTDDDVAHTAAIIASRPKKQPRSILNRMNTTAKYLGIGAAGAAGALAVLSALPDAFFV